MTITLDLLYAIKTTGILHLPKFIKMTSLRIFKSPVVDGLQTSNLRIRYISLEGVPPQDAVAALTDNQVILTDIHICSYERATVIKFGQKYTALIEVHRTLSEMLVTSLLFNHVTYLLMT